jgi:DNA replication protein DnaC
LRKTRADFDGSVQPAIDRRARKALAKWRCLDPGANVLFLGPPGVGNPHLAVALGMQAAEAGSRGLCTTATDLVTPLAPAWAEHRVAERRNGRCQPKRRLIDARGDRPLDARAATPLLQRVARREARGSSILTSHTSSSDWGATCAGDSVIAAARLARLRRHATTITIQGESDRLTDKRRAGLMQPLTTVPEGGGVMASPYRLREGVGAFGLGASGCLFHR